MSEGTARALPGHTVCVWCAAGHRSTRPRSIEWPSGAGMPPWKGNLCDECERKIRASNESSNSQTRAQLVEARERHERAVRRSLRRDAR